MEVTAIRFVKFATASTLTDCINLRLLLDRVQIPYRVANECLAPWAIPGSQQSHFFGQAIFWVPEHLSETARNRIEELFDVNASSVPAECPACDTHISRGQLECPNCGLFLC